MNYACESATKVSAATCEHGNDGVHSASIDVWSGDEMLFVFLLKA